eukprot:3498672-Prymnesium_polylepis.1
MALVPPLALRSLHPPLPVATYGGGRHASPTLRPRVAPPLPLYSRGSVLPSSWRMVRVINKQTNGTSRLLRRRGWAPRGYPALTDRNAYRFKHSCTNH